MIISGYPGIEKTSVAKENNLIIDLESSSFWKKRNGTKKRPKDWQIYYCQMAQFLSNQGYTVFVSCHNEVSEWLRSNHKESYMVIHPAKELKNDWIERLKKRYENSKSSKNLRAFKRAEKKYDQDIENFIKVKNNFCNTIQIKSIYYDLNELIRQRQVAYHINNLYFSIHETEEGYDYSVYDENYVLIDGGVYDDNTILIEKAIDLIVEGDFVKGISALLKRNNKNSIDYEKLEFRTEVMNRI